MTIDELFESLDGCGVIYEDKELVEKTLLEWGWKDGLETELHKIYSFFEKIDDEV